MHNDQWEPSSGDLKDELVTIRQKLADLEAKQENCKPTPVTGRRRAFPKGLVFGLLILVAGLLLIGVAQSGNSPAPTSNEFQIETDGTVRVTGNVAPPGGIGNFLVPRGAIILWNGAKEELDALEGWELCDGPNNGGTCPDLRMVKSDHHHAYCFGDNCAWWSNTMGLPRGDIIAPMHQRGPPGPGTREDASTEAPGGPAQLSKVDTTRPNTWPPYYEVAFIMKL